MVSLKPVESLSFKGTGSTTVVSCERPPLHNIWLEYSSSLVSQHHAHDITRFKLKWPLYSVLVEVELSILTDDFLQARLHGDIVLLSEPSWIRLRPEV